MQKPLTASRTTTPWRSAEIVSLLTLAALFLLVLYSYQVRLPGAFVFGDQTEYAGMVQSLLSGQHMRGYQQYGPLYPAIIALLQSALPNLSMFRAGLSINLVVSLAALLPFYRLCRALFMPGWMTMLCALTLVLAPFWAFSTVTWADPLFYTLFFFSLYGAFDIAPEDGWHRYLLLGILLGLMFLAKPIGLFYVVAMLMSLVIARRGWSDGKNLAQVLTVAAGSALCILPWIYRNIEIEHTSALGYSYVGTMFKEMLETAGWAKMIGLFLAAVGFHLAYISFSALGAATIIPAMTLQHWRALSLRERVLICYIVSSLAAITGISAVHMFVNPYLGYWMPNGRYLTQYVPPLLLLAAVLWRKTVQAQTHIPTAWGVLSCILTAAIVYLFSPLESMATFSIFNNPEIAPYSLLLDGKDIVWRGHFAPTEWQRLIPTMATLLLCVSFFFLRRWRGVVMGCIVLSILYLGVTSWHQSRLIRMMAWTQKPVNEFFRQDAQEKKQIDLCMPEGLYFDVSLQNRNIDFIRGFWCPTSVTRFVTPEEACQEQASQSPSTIVSNQGPLFVTATGTREPHGKSFPYDNHDFSISHLSCTEQ
ncbi:glycosyltransferase family 39 protein [Herbaspirillum rubrisubalbicans]|uniref:glycosyltransferase family 39 protein n=1 Tax=Herbaspirillum rubrisubalbicans TaxID=80842 RepID=UPI001558B728|nr:glycosyltransferase family 39 protein [Herbaspirillum rubrisubalbicans]NQE51545.1 hypothetical protein [Herbaspirillum rubrisubalbicans]